MLNIALFLGQLQLDSQRKVIEGIRERIVADGNNLFVYSMTLTVDDSYNSGECVVAFDDDFSIYDGFILYTASIYSEEVRQSLIKKVCKLNKPVVSIDCFTEGVINVSSNNEHAMKDLTKHLIHEHGARTINFVGGPEDSINALARKKAFIEEMAANGITSDKNRFYVGDFYARSGGKAVKYFESLNLLEADAYVCANDQMALGVYYALTERGYKVPEDVLITGYDDIDEAANHYPRITSVTRYEERLGTTAYDNLIKWINGEEYETDISVDSEVVYAESCGCDLGRDISHKLIINNFIEKSLRNTRHAEMISEFSTKVTSINSYEMICEELKKYIPLLGGDAYAVCFFEEINKPEKVKRAVFYKKKCFETRENYISTNKLDVIPDDSSGNFYIINSIHFGNCCYGFTMIRNSFMPLQSEFYQLFEISLSSVIEHINNTIKMQEMIKTLDEMWVFDPMTHVYNRAGFFKFADEMMVEARYNKENLFLIFLDLDGLKKVNDVYGHEMGDKLICDMADILRKCRDKEELLMRYGGDEFVIFGEGYEEDKVKAYVERIRTSMEEINNKADREYRIDASIGYSEIAYDDNRPLSGLIEIADQNMYKEKREKHKKENM